MIFESRFGKMKFERFNHVNRRHRGATLEVCKFSNMRQIGTHIRTCLSLGHIARRTQTQIELRVDLNYIVGCDLRNNLAHKLSLWYYVRDLQISTIFPMSCRIRNCPICNESRKG